MFSKNKKRIEEKVVVLTVKNIQWIEKGNE